MPYCEVALAIPLEQHFFYSVPDSIQLKPGVRVIVPFGPRKLIGVVLRCNADPAGIEPSSIKPIQQALDDDAVLSPELLRLGRWISDYYFVPEGEVLASMLPRNAPVLKRDRIVLTATGEASLNNPSTDGSELAVLRRIAKRNGIRRETLRPHSKLVQKLHRRGWIRYEQSLEARAAIELAAADDPTAIEATDRHDLTTGQSAVLCAIERKMDSGQFGVVLLHGVTGSGKTEVYLRAIEHCLAKNRPALMLVPEISLTPAMAGLFDARFGNRVAVLHSGMSDNEREEQWHRVRTGRSDVVLGTRSAVFAPLNRPGLVIVDEEHDWSYKQEEAPRYHGRDMAIVRARDAGATVILGSATPAIETRHNAETGRYQLLELEHRVQERPLAQTEIVDMRQEFVETGKKSFLSRRLEEEIEKRLQQHEQNLILMNRRGYSAFVLCRTCGHSIECPNCSIALTHHKRFPRLLCHYCGHARAIPKFCPECASEHLYFMGEGSEQIEEALQRRFPAARIGRLDRDTAAGRGRAAAILAAFRNHELDILVGTQMIAKGHDIHRVTLVGVISADIGLARPDFRAAERTFQLLTQVAGRAGRGDLPGEVIIQTYYPEHYAIRSAAAQDYAMFYAKELGFRQVMHYPPFSVLANVIIKSPSAENALKITGRLGRHLEAQQKPGLKLLGPAAAPIHKLKKDYRYHFLIKASRHRILADVLHSCRDFARTENFPPTAMIIDVDPQSFT
ncbi:MAG: primosomal protein N' [Acidobacteria bacterium]|nr:primosomal protein N' [Acidobacteriota bacterium]